MVDSNVDLGTYVKFNYTGTNHIGKVILYNGTELDNYHHGDTVVAFLHRFSDTYEVVDHIHLKSVEVEKIELDDMQFALMYGYRL